MVSRHRSWRVAVTAAYRLAGRTGRRHVVTSRTYAGARVWCVAEVGAL